MHCVKALKPKGTKYDKLQLATSILCKHQDLKQRRFTLKINQVFLEYNTFSMNCAIKIMLNINALCTFTMYFIHLLQVLIAFMFEYTSFIFYGLS